MKKKSKKSAQNTASTPDWLHKILDEYSIDSSESSSTPSSSTSSGQFSIPTLNAASISPSYTWSGLSDYSGHNPKVHITNQGINLDAEADIRIGGISIKKSLEDISRRLEILIPDPRLEREYEELKQARENYERIREKLEMLEVLKKAPPKMLDS